MKKLMYLSFTFMHFCGGAQIFQWVSPTGGQDFDVANAVVANALGHTFSTGEYALTADFDPGPGVFNLSSVGNNSAYVLKLDDSGNLLWAKSIDGISSSSVSVGQDIALDQSGNVYITGEYRGEIDADPGPGSFILNTSSTSNKNSFIIKLDPNGNFIKAIQFRNAGFNAENTSNAIKVNDVGDICVTGQFIDTVAFSYPPAQTVILSSANNTYDGFVAQFDAGLNLSWVKNFASTEEAEGRDLIFSNTGNILVTGDFQGTTDFDPGTGVFNLVSPLTNAGSDVYVVSLDANGNFNWAQGIIRTATAGGAMWSNHAECIVENSADEIFVSGRFLGTTDFDPGPNNFNLTATGSEDGYVLKLDPAGGFLWVNQLGGNDITRVNGIDVFPNTDELVITGSFSGTTDFDPGAGVQNMTSNGSNDIYVSRWSAQGAEIWTVQYGAGSWDAASDVDINNDQIFTVGGFQDNVDFDHGFGNSIQTSNGSFDSFVHLLYDDGFTGSESISLWHDNTFVYPNPSAQAFRISSEAEYDEVLLQDLSGRIVARFNGTEPYSTDQITPGTYFVQLLNEGAVVSSVQMNVTK